MNASSDSVLTNLRSHHQFGEEVDACNEKARQFAVPGGTSANPFSSIFALLETCRYQSSYTKWSGVSGIGVDTSAILIRGRFNGISGIPIATASRHAGGMEAASTPLGASCAGTDYQKSYILLY